jgi:hypothetical protein
VELHSLQGQFRPTDLPITLLLKGGKAMIGISQLIKFKKMWAWLSGYPAHDRTYYMQHVVVPRENWMNNCPLCNSEHLNNCDGCKFLWQSRQGTLCTDLDSPLYKWRATDIQQPDERSFYASQVAVLALKAIRGLENKMGRGEVGKAA